jgi:hypothetical protein
VSESGFRPDFPKPWVHASGWQEQLHVAPDTVRAALLSGHGQAFYNVHVVRDDGEGISMTCQYEGWQVDRGQVGEKWNRMAVRRSSPLAGKRISLFRKILNFRLGYFTLNEAEAIALEFIEARSQPLPIEWIEFRRA